MSKAIYPDEPYLCIEINMGWAGVRKTYLNPDSRQDRRVIADDNRFEGL